MNITGDSMAETTIIVTIIYSNTEFIKRCITILQDAIFIRSMKP